MLPSWIRWERVLCAVLLLGAWLPTAWIGAGPHLAIRLFLLLLTGWQIGETFAPRSWGEGMRLFLGVTAWAGLLSLGMTALYYLSIPLTATVRILVETGIAAAALASPLVFARPEPTETEAPRARVPLFDIALFIVSGAAFAFACRLLTTHATHASVQTPWTLLPNGAFLILSLPFAAALLAAWKARTRLVRFAATTFAWLTVAATTTLLYPLGYGFDGFIHRASEAELLRTGVLVPKPLYYIGQYVWTTWVAQALDLSLRAVDLWLLPLALCIPLAAALVWSRDGQPGARWRLPFLLLFLPLGAFVATTPQSFAYVLALTALIGTLWPHETRRSWLFPLLAALWATAAHPLGGLPALVFVGGLWMASLAKRPLWRESASALAALGALLAIPAAFWIQSRLGGTGIGWSWEAFRAASVREAVSEAFLAPRQTLALWIDATEWTRIALWILAGGLGIRQVLRPKKPALRWLAVVGLGLVVVRWFLEHVATFGFLISYEQHNYTDRLGVLGALFLAPGAADWLARRFDGLDKRSGALFSGLLIAFCALWGLRVYDSLPRHDAARASSGWSVGAGDLAAIHWIHEQGNGERYAVLANQSVSAAALEAYGFLRYAGDVFYYPIPTGGPLYERFLRIASTDGTPQDIQAAAELSASETVFVVIDKYWWNADRVNERLASEAAQSLSFDDGAVWVYRFEAKKNAP